MTNIKRIAICGGPTSGKTGMIKRLKNLTSDNSVMKAVFVEEIANMFFKDINEELLKTDNPVLRQTRIFRVQQYVENLAAKICTDLNRPAVIITDRGVNDLYCYLKEWEVADNFTPEELSVLSGRYDSVYYLSPAQADDITTRISTNSARQETQADEILGICEVTYKAWAKYYPEMNVIPQYPKADEKAAVIAKMINHDCGEEIFKINQP